MVSRAEQTAPLGELIRRERGHDGGSSSPVGEAGLAAKQRRHAIVECVATAQDLGERIRSGEIAVVGQRARCAAHGSIQLQPPDLTTWRKTMSK